MSELICENCGEVDVTLKTKNGKKVCSTCYRSLV